MKQHPITYEHVGNLILILIVGFIIWSAGAYWIGKIDDDYPIRCDDLAFFGVHLCKYKNGSYLYLKND